MVVVMAVMGMREGWIWNFGQDADQRPVIWVCLGSRVVVLFGFNVTG
jgi:hypothetical protein